MTAYTVCTSRKAANDPAVCNRYTRCLPGMSQCPSLCQYESCSSCSLEWKSVGGVSPTVSSCTAAWAICATAHARDIITFSILYSVVKVRGKAGERRSWTPKNCCRAFPGPTQALVVQIFPTIHSWLTPRLLWLVRFFWASRFFFIFSFLH